MKRRLGLGISAHAVRAVLIKEGRIEWAGVANWSDEAELTEAIGRLATESGRAASTAAVALERDVVQLRTVLRAPRLSAAAARQYAMLESPRLFRRNGVTLAIDAVIVRVDAGTTALLTAAASEQLLKAILEGCAQAGLEVEAVGPAADVVHVSVSGTDARDLVFPNGGTSEVVSVSTAGAWRSRRVSGVLPATSAWHPALATMGEEASHFAAAFSVALTLPRLQLLPAHSRVAREGRSRARLFRLAGAAILLWCLAIAVYITRLSITTAAATRELAGRSVEIDSALALRRELEAARATVDRFALAEATRSRELATLAEVTRLLGDSAFLSSYRTTADGRISLSGYAPSAARVVANLERASSLREPRLESQIAREALAGRGELDRFAITARRVMP